MKGKNTDLENSYPSDFGEKKNNKLEHERRRVYCQITSKGQNGKLEAG